MKKSSYDNLCRFLYCAILITILVLVVLIYKKVSKNSSPSNPPPAMLARMYNSKAGSLPDLRIKIVGYDDVEALGADDSGNTYTIQNAGLKTRIGSSVTLSTQCGTYPLQTDPNNFLNGALAFVVAGVPHTIAVSVSALFSQYVILVKNSPNTVAWVSIQY